MLGLHPRDVAVCKSADPLSDPPDPERETEIASRHGQVIVGQPDGRTADRGGMPRLQTQVCKRLFLNIKQHAPRQHWRRVVRAATVAHSGAPLRQQRDKRAPGRSGRGRLAIGPTDRLPSIPRSGARV